MLAPLLDLHRLDVVTCPDPFGSSDLTATNVTGVLRTSTREVAHVARCPDVVTLVTALWQRRPYGAYGQILRPNQLSPTRIELESVWVGGASVVLVTDSARWDAEVTSLARVVARHLEGGPHGHLTAALAPVLVPV